MNNKDLIAQYVDTGLKLPDYQVTKLPSWGGKTYIRKRLIAIKNTSIDMFLSGHEIGLLNSEQSEQYFHDYYYEYFKVAQHPNNPIHNNIERDLKFFPDKYKEKYVETQIGMDNRIYLKVFEVLDTKDKIKYLKWNVQIGIGKHTIYEIFYELPHDLKVFYIKELFKVYGKEEALNNKHLRWKISNNKDWIWNVFEELVDNVINYE